MIGKEQAYLSRLDLCRVLPKGCGEWLTNGEKTDDLSLVEVMDDLFHFH